MKVCPACKEGDYYEEIEGNFKVATNDGYHGRETKEIYLYRCKLCGNVFT